MCSDIYDATVFNVTFIKLDIEHFDYFNDTIRINMPKSFNEQTSFISVCKVKKTTHKYIVYHTCMLKSSSDIIHIANTSLSGLQGTCRMMRLVTL